MRTILIAGGLVIAIIFLAGQNQKLRSERNLMRDRLEAVAGSREIENVVRAIDDCGLIDLLIGGIDVRSENGGAVLGCAEAPAEPEASNSGIPGQE